jgi:hypothetical protein
MTLHPTYLAKSYYPGTLIEELKLRHLGSRAVHIRPRKSATKKAVEDPRAQPAPLFYLAGSVDRISRFARSIEDWNPADEKLEREFSQIEEIDLPGKDRAKFFGKKRVGEIPMEVVLHAEAAGDEYIIEGFQAYAKSLNLDPAIDRRRHAGGLCFLPMRATQDQVEGLLDFAFLRAIRPMARIVALDPIVRSIVPGFKVSLPTDPAIAPELSAAIFDGGLPPKHGLELWVSEHDGAGVGAPIASAQKHGLAVTSAFLFGPLEPGAVADRPPVNVDHWRIVGEDTRHDDFELFSLLDRIEDVLSTRRYDFVNVSLGPDCAVEDDDVNAWTSTLDTLLAQGETVATVACGNNGEKDAALKLDRIQPPSDGVNMIAVGAADRLGTPWARALYSARGPGRSPGYVKPDLVSFGGSPGSPFLLLGPGNPVIGAGLYGTSFAAPLALRSGAVVRAQFSEPLWAPTVKALLIHHASDDGHDRTEVGWGRLSHNLGDLVLCDDGEAHVIYQRQMPATGSVRLYLPIPPNLSGEVEIKATFCLYCDVDPEDAINYTRGGLEIQFRPDTHKIPKPYIKDGKVITPTSAVTDPFFGAKDFYAPEFLRRDDAQKWETTVTRMKRKRASSLRDPAFDVSHITRQHGHSGGRVPNIKFALILTIRNKHALDLYDRVVASARARLQPMRPRTGVRLPTKTKP